MSGVQPFYFFVQIKKLCQEKYPLVAARLSPKGTRYMQNQSDFETTVHTRDKVVWQGKYTRLFIGKHHNYADRWMGKEGGDRGNTLLFRLPSGKYLFVGFNVVEFTVPETMHQSMSRWWATLPFRIPWPTDAPTPI